jgi:hypothetical protein
MTASRHDFDELNNQRHPAICHRTASYVFPEAFYLPLQLLLLRALRQAFVLSLTRRLLLLRTVLNCAPAISTTSPFIFKTVFASLHSFQLSTSTSTLLIRPTSIRSRMKHFAMDTQRIITNDACMAQGIMRKWHYGFCVCALHGNGVLTCQHYPFHTPVLRCTFELTYLVMLYVVDVPRGKNVYMMTNKCW